MARPIDGDKLQTDMMEMVASGLYDMEDMIDAVIEAPTISPDEVRGVGEWIYCHSDMEYKCSLCGKQLDDYVNASEWAGLSEIPNYCPNCGAKMKGAEDGTTYAE